MWWLLVVALGVLGYFWVRNTYSYWLKRGVPQLSPVPVLGDVWELITFRKFETQVFNEMTAEAKRREEPALGFYFLWKPMLLVRDEELIKRILVSDFDSFADHPDVTKCYSTDQVVKSLFVMTNAEWKSRRSFFTNLLTPKRLRQYLFGMRNNFDDVLPLFDTHAESSQDFDVHSVMEKYSMNVITQTLFGLKTDALHNPNSVFYKYGAAAGNPPLWCVIKSLILLAAPTIYDLFKMVTFPSFVHREFVKFVREVIDYRIENKLEMDDVLGAMIKIMKDVPKFSSDPKNLEMGIQEITAHIFTFFQAGYDTTALTSSYALFELSRAPFVQDKLRTEILRVLDQHGGELSYEALKEMTYMDHVVAETLRLYSPTGTLKRVCKKPYTTPDGRQIEPDTVIVIPNQFLQMDPEFFSDPETFDPDRFETNSSPPFVYMPFGKGPRACVGMAFGELEVKIALAMILQKYKILPSPKTSKPIDVFPSIFIAIRPKNGLYVRFKKLSSDHLL